MTKSDEDGSSPIEVEPNSMPARQNPTNVYRLKAASIESTAEVSVPELGQIHRLESENVESITEVTQPRLFLNKIIELVDESNEQIKQGVKEDIKEFFKEKIEDITGIKIDSVVDYLTRNMPDHLLEHINFAIDILNKAILFFK